MAGLSSAGNIGAGIGSSGTGFTGFSGMDISSLAALGIGLGLNAYTTNLQYKLGMKKLKEDRKKANQSTKLKIAQYNTNQARLAGLGAAMSGKANDVFSKYLINQQPQYQSDFFSSNAFKAYNDIKREGGRLSYAKNHNISMNNLPSLQNDYQKLNVLNRQAMNDATNYMLTKPEYKQLNYKNYTV